MNGHGQTSALWLLVAMLGGATLSGGASAASITVATYNVENYGTADRRVDNVYRQDYPKPETAKTALRAVIRALDADVLALQEMGPAGYLSELQRDLQAEGLNYPYKTLAEAGDTERHLAVLSRIPFRRVQVHDNLDFRYFGEPARVKRGLLEVVVAVDGAELTLFMVHLRSRFTERPDDPNAATFRAGEAKAIRDFVLGRFPEPVFARFIIMGDCNDTRNSKAFRLLTRRGSTIIAVPARAVDRNGEAWTYCYSKEDAYSRVDYILASPAVMSAAAAEGAHIYDGPGVGDASDHRPVVITVKFPGRSSDNAATGPSGKNG